MTVYRTVSTDLDPLEELAMASLTDDTIKQIGKQRKATLREQKRALSAIKAQYQAGSSAWFTNCSYVSTSSSTITITGGTGGGLISSGDIFVGTGEDVMAVPQQTLSEEDRNKAIQEMLERRYGEWLKLLSTENGSQHLRITKDHGQKLRIDLPDGHVLEMDHQSNFKILSKDAKVTYKANPTREFNKYINASDLLAQFIKDLGLVGATQKQVLQVPLELFINWLVVSSAEQDEEPVPEGIPAKADLPKLACPRCKQCGRFLSRDHMEVNFSFCNGMHADKFMASRKDPAKRQLIPVKG